ncbi:hypothetical protein Tco_1455525, partial [Tanacetum coccineum]
GIFYLALDDYIIDMCFQVDADLSSELLALIEHLFLKSARDSTFQSIRGVAYLLRPRLCYASSLGTPVMSKGFQAKTARLFARNSTTDLIVNTFILRFWMTVHPSITLYLDVDLRMWNCNMIVLNSGYDPTCSHIMSTVLPPSMYILLTVSKAIIDVITVRSDDMMKVSYGMFRDKTCDQFSITSLPILLLDCHD